MCLYVQETKKRPGIQQSEPGQRGLGAVFGGVSSDWPWSACCSVMHVRSLKSAVEGEHRSQLANVANQGSTSLRAHC